MPRQARLDSPGVHNHAMIQGIERRNIFRDDVDRNDFIERLIILLPETRTFYKIRKTDILSKGRQKTTVVARSLFCFLASRYLGTTITELARLTGMAPSAISYAVIRGKKTAEEKEQPFLMELLKN